MYHQLQQKLISRLQTQAQGVRPSVRTSSGGWTEEGQRDREEQAEPGRPTLGQKNLSPHGDRQRASNTNNYSMRRRVELKDRSSVWHTSLRGLGQLLWTLTFRAAPENIRLKTLSVME